MKRFAGQVAVVSGGADGLGKGIAERIAAEGGTVALFDINEQLLEETVHAFKSRGLAVSGHVVDISSEEMVRESFAAVQTAYGRIDVMVNSAGIIGPTSTKITEYSTEAFDQIYAVNQKGTFLMTKYAIKAMEKANYGRILLMASIAGKEGNPGMVGYSTTKSAVIGLVKSVGKEYAETGIRINGLAPAVIKTAMVENADPAQVAYMVSRIPMNRLGTVEEVAAMSAWIVSQECSFSTGFIFDLTGGRATY